MKASIRLLIIVIFTFAVVSITLFINSRPSSDKASDTTNKGAIPQIPTTTKSPSAATVFPLSSPPGNTLAPGPNLAPGSNTSYLPGDLLIADNNGNRILIINAAGEILWQYPPLNEPNAPPLTHPDDAFFTSNMQDIIVTQEDYQMVSLVNIKSDAIIASYGTPDTPGSGPNHLDNPDDALQMPNGNVIVPNIKNCSIMVFKFNTLYPLERIGSLTNNCLHYPPYRFGSPNGVLPLSNGNFIVTEINGDWADEMTARGEILWSTHPPNIAYPSDTNEVSPGIYITAAYTNPGAVVEFNRYGSTIWRYVPQDANGVLNQPSLCEVIPTNNFVICNDDYNDRIIIINPKTNQIVWQYGHRGIAGTGPGYLSKPDGLDLAPPYSLLIRHFSTMSSLPQPCYTPSSVCTYNANASTPG